MHLESLMKKPSDFAQNWLSSKMDTRKHVYQLVTRYNHPISLSTLYPTNVMASSVWIHQNVLKIFVFTARNSSPYIQYNVPK